MTLLLAVFTSLVLPHKAHDPFVASVTGGTTLNENIPGCVKTYTIPMAQRAARYVYSGTRRVTSKNGQMLHRIARCQRNRGAIKYVLWYYHHERQAWLRRIALYQQLNPPLQGPVVASWYYDGNGGGCGFQAAYGVATLIAPCGTKFKICNNGACVIATRDDSGPYVSGRTFDLGLTTRAALGCAGLCSVTYAIVP